MVVNNEFNKLNITIGTFSSLYGYVYNKVNNATLIHQINRHIYAI